MDITLRQLVSHLGGIRHYKKNDSKETEFEKKEYYITEHFPTAIKSLSIFKDDPLGKIVQTKLSPIFLIFV